MAKASGKTAANLKVTRPSKARADSTSPGRGQAALSKKRVRFKKTRLDECVVLPSKAHPVLSEYFGYCLTKSTYRLRKMLADEYEKLNVHLPAAGMLQVLFQTGPQTQIALGDEVGVDKASMVKLIDSLEKSGYVKRKTHATDRRAKVLEITAKGHAVLPKLRSIRLKVEGEFLSSLTKTEAEIFRALCKKILLSGPVIKSE